MCFINKTFSNQTLTNLVRNFDSHELSPALRILYWSPSIRHICQYSIISTILFLQRNPRLSSYQSWWKHSELSSSSFDFDCSQFWDRCCESSASTCSCIPRASFTKTFLPHVLTGTVFPSWAFPPLAGPAATSLQRDSPVSLSRIHLKVVSYRIISGGGA